LKPSVSAQTESFEQFMQRRNFEVSLSYHVIVVTLEEHMSYSNSAQSQ